MFWNWSELQELALHEQSLTRALKPWSYFRADMKSLQTIYNHTFLVTAVISPVSLIPYFCLVSCRFHVNLQCGSHSGADVALHFNPRYESTGYVVNNTYQNRNWGSEERKYESPFPQGQTFTLQILVAQDAYKVQDHSLSDFLFLKRFWIALVLMSSFFHFYQQNDIAY